MRTWKDYPITKNINGSYTVTTVINGQELPYNVCADDVFGLINFAEVEIYYESLDAEKQLTETVVIISESEQLEIYRNRNLSNLRKKLSDSDYHQSKMIDGTMTTEEYEPIKIKRASWRAAFNAVQVATSIEEINTIMEGCAE